MPELRLHACQQVKGKVCAPQTDDRRVGIMVAGERAWFRGVIACGLVWLCPVCAARAAETRRRELQLSIDNAIRAGGWVALVTLTVRHGRADPLAEVLGAFLDARRKLASWRPYKRLAARFGLVGQIRTLEITYGVNGWHPHTHALAFFRRPLSPAELDEFRAELLALWQRALRREGFSCDTHGVDVRGGSEAAAYVSKWGFAGELARPAAKRGRGQGRTPWQLLEHATQGDEHAAALWREFAAEFHRRRQLTRSPGLRDLVGDLLDDVAAADPEPVEGEPEPQCVAAIHPAAWRLVRRMGIEGHVLRCAVQEGHEALAGMLAGILRRYGESAEWADCAAWAPLRHAVSAEWP